MPVLSERRAPAVLWLKQQLWLLGIVNVVTALRLLVPTGPAALGRLLLKHHLLVYVPLAPLSAACLVFRLLVLLFAFVLLTIITVGTDTGGTGIRLRRHRFIQLIVVPRP